MEQSRVEIAGGDYSAAIGAIPSPVGDAPRSLLPRRGTLTHSCQIETAQSRKRFQSPHHVPSGVPRSLFPFTC